MNATNAEYLNTFETWVARERTSLVGFCRHLTGSPQAAEDLAQETLLTAWQRRDAITNPNGLSHWLKAIARNVCRHWQRSQVRQNKHLLQPNQHACDEAHTEIEPVDEFDLDRELERSELITLLDRAMALLPPETRGLLIQHYIEELPQAELAAQAGLSTNAMTVRLHRGKLALRQALVTDFQDDAMAYGLVTSNEVGWVETRMWCFQCGQHRLQARFNRAKNHLCLRCPGCCNLWSDEEDTLTNSCVDGLGKFKAFKPAFSHVQKCVHTIYFEQEKVGFSTCYQCGASIPIRYGSPPGMPVYQGAVYAVCDHCHEGSIDSWNSLALSLPQIRQFWRDHPRMASLPDQWVEIGGNKAVLTGFESVTESAKIEVAFSQNTFEVIYVD